MGPFLVFQKEKLRMAFINNEADNANEVQSETYIHTINKGYIKTTKTNCQIELSHK